MSAAAACASLPAAACYTGLILIPTTDTACAYTWVVDLQYQSYSNAFKTNALIVNTELGLGDRAEIGLDLDVTPDANQERRVLLNAKLVVFKSERHGFSCAVGFGNMTPSFATRAYVVATEDLKVLRLHAGLQYHKNQYRTDAFVGLDRRFANGFVLMADYTNGDPNFASAGIGYVVSEKFGFSAGVQYPNAGGPTVLVFHVVWTGTYGKRS